MSKKQETALNVYTLAVLNLIFWICGNVPRKIVNFDDIGSAASYIVHLLYFALFALFIVIAFAKDKTIFSGKVFDKNLSVAKRWELGKWMALFLLQIAFDCAVGLLSSIAAQWKYIGFYLLIPLYWVIIYLIFVGKRHLKKENAKIFIFCAFFVLSLTVVSLWITDFLISDYIGLLPKYQSNSPVLSAVKSNTEFLHGLQALLVDTMIGISLLLMNRVLTEDENKTVRCNFTVFSSRMLVIGAVLLMCIFPKTICPDGLLSSFGMHTTNHTSYEYFDEVKELGHTWTVYRLSSERKNVPCYQKERMTLSVDGVTSVELTRSYIDELYPYYMKDNALDEVCFLYPVLSEEAEVYIYNSQVICFYEDEVPQMMKVEDIQYYEESEILTRVCKKLLSQGNIYIFEYAAAYLERYAPDFIADYTERYANGNFTEAELHWMEINDYCDTYIIGIAKNIRRK